MANSKSNAIQHVLSSSSSPFVFQNRRSEQSNVNDPRINSNLANLMKRSSENGESVERNGPSAKCSRTLSQVVFVSNDAIGDASKCDSTAKPAKILHRRQSQRLMNMIELQKENETNAIAGLGSEVVVLHKINNAETTTTKATTTKATTQQSKANPNQKEMKEKAMNSNAKLANKIKKKAMTQYKKQKKIHHLPSSSFVSSLNKKKSHELDAPNLSTSNSTGSFIITDLNKENENKKKQWILKSNASRAILAQFTDFTDLGNKRGQAKCIHCPQYEKSKHYTNGNNTNLKTHLRLVSFFALFLFCIKILLFIPLLYKFYQIMCLKYNRSLDASRNFRIIGNFQF